MNMSDLCSSGQVDLCSLITMIRWCFPLCSWRALTDPQSSTGHRFDRSLEFGLSHESFISTSSATRIKPPWCCSQHDH
jgi:hypothetical protein